MTQDFDWEGRYREDTAGWDKGEAVPGLTDWLAGTPPVSGNVLVPGCGRGHEAAAVAAAWPEAQVLGMDIAETAVKEARERYSGPNLSFEIGDFFAQSGEGDLTAVVEHTCFCAIPPEMRVRYRDVCARRLKVGGRLIAVFYLHPVETEDEPDAGPPWGTSVPELNGLFGTQFKTLLSEVPGRSFPERERRELLRVLEKK